MRKKLISVLLVMGMTLSMLAGCGGGDSASETAEETEAAAETSDDFDLLIGVSIRSLDNEYFVFVQEGIEAFAEQLREETGMKVEVQTLLCEYSNDQQINDIKTLIARGGDKCILYVDPNDTTICGSIAEICEEAGVYWGTT